MSTSSAMSAGSAGGALPATWAWNSSRNWLKMLVEHGLLLGGQVAAGAVADGADALLDDLEIGGGGVGAGEAIEQGGQVDAVGLAGGALAAGLDGQEAGDAGGDGDHVGGLGEDDEPGRAEAAADASHAFVADRHVELFGEDHRVGDAAEHRLDRRRRSAADGFEDVPQRCAHGDLADAVALDVAGDGGHDGAG